jgi:hypothetical protein
VVAKRNVGAAKKHTVLLEETTSELEVVADQFDPNSPLFSSQSFEDPELGL